MFSAARIAFVTEMLSSNEMSSRGRTAILRCSASPWRASPSNGSFRRLVRPETTHLFKGSTGEDFAELLSREAGRRNGLFCETIFPPEGFCEILV